MYAVVALSVPVVEGDALCWGHIGQEVVGTFRVAVKPDIAGDVGGILYEVWDIGDDVWDYSHGRLVLAFLDVDVGGVQQSGRGGIVLAVYRAVLYKHIFDFGCRESYCRAAGFGGDVWVSACLQQRSDHVGVAVPRSHMQGCESAFVGLVDISALSERQNNAVQIVAFCQFNKSLSKCSYRSENTQQNDSLHIFPCDAYLVVKCGVQKIFYIVWIFDDFFFYPVVEDGADS